MINKMSSRKVIKKKVEKSQRKYKGMKPKLKKIQDELLYSDSSDQHMFELIDIIDQLEENVDELKEKLMKQNQLLSETRLETQFIQEKQKEKIKRLEQEVVKTSNLELIHNEYLSKLKPLEEMRLQFEETKRKELENERLELQDEKESESEKKELYKHFRENGDLVSIEQTLQKYVFTLYDPWAMSVKQIFEYIKKNNEIILKYRVGNFMYHTDFTDVSFYNIITNKNLYRLWNVGGGILRAGSIYTFERELSVKSLQIIKQIYNEIGQLYIGPLNGGYNQDPNRLNISHLKHFESVIRLIPGSFQNDSWVELDGFYGGYYNRLTNKLSMVPPAIENAF